MLWVPNKGPQTRFLASNADEALYGGAAGGGKSAAAVALPLRFVHRPRFRCLFLRREARYLRDAIDKSESIYPKLGARRNQSTNTWYFPSGAQVWLNHCEHESDIANYDSLEFNLVIFEELTHFTERQYLGIKARIRGADPESPHWVRATTNPGGIGHEWVFNRWGNWLNPAIQPRAASGEKLWFTNEPTPVPRGTEHALSRTFIAARLEDNPYIGPEYKAQILQLDAVRRAQLGDGDWLAKPGEGKYFKRSWIKDYFDIYPHASRRVRYWDLAAGGDYAAGIRYSRVGSGWCIEDLEHLKATPGKVRELVYATARRDGPSVEVHIEQDPGQAGKDQAFSYTTAPELQGFTVRFRPKRVDKVTAFGPFSSRVEAGLVGMVRGAWNQKLFEECEAFPDGKHDDICDALSGAHAVLIIAEPASFTEQKTAFSSFSRRE
mgnify:CR=1 FL=1